MVTIPEAILVDINNYDDIAPQIRRELVAATLVGLDLETFDHAHEALEKYRSSVRKVIFDVNRTTITGLSLYADGMDNSYYFNLFHADVENRIPWEHVATLLDLVVNHDDKIVVCHNAPFEITMLQMAADYILSNNIVCTLQMAVTAYGPDEYDRNRFQTQRLKPLSGLMNEIKLNFTSLTDEKFDAYNLNEKQRALVGKVCSKTTRGTESYNGMVQNVCYGYGLKKLVDSAFGYKMQTFAETLGKKKNMGELTGAETANYGADDAFWAVEVYKWLLDYMMVTNPKVVRTFFEQENPMIYQYAAMWTGGMRVNLPNIIKQRAVERKNAAQVYRDLKPAIKKWLPFNDDPEPELFKENKIYANTTTGKGYQKYRQALIDFANTPDVEDDYEMCRQVRGSVSNAWAAEKGEPESTAVNLVFYVSMQTLLYDLVGIKPRRDKGKINLDKDMRERLLKVYKGEPQEELLAIIDRLSGIEQRMKLYLTPYMGLTDPETGKMYPIVSSKLATRRLACSFPNAMQLSKQGESTYIRGFYLPDSDEDVIISLDWSQVELVLIGEFSKDPEFAKCYSSVPYDDLHTIAAAALMGMTEKEVKEHKDYKKFRKEYGKGSNFNYWYSGALWTVGNKLGMSQSEIKDKGAKYRERFCVAEDWRVALINEARGNGYITLPDETRRVKFESTDEWRTMMRGWFSGHEGLKNFGDIIIRKTATRAGNQIVNAMIQGTCATLAKRSAMEIVNECARQGIRARFMIPIHDELVWSVRRTDVVRFLEIARKCMTDHPDIVKDLVLDCTASIGNTFEPYKKGKVPFGQIEIDELPEEFCITTAVDGRATTEEVLAILAYLEKEKKDE